MPIVYDELLALDIPVREVSYSDRETMLYALSVGMGQDPMDLAELPFVFEKNLKALPSLSTVICWDDSWTPRTGINYVMVVHGEQRITIHKPLPASGRVKAKVRIKDVFDKGAGKGAIMLVENTITDAASGEKLVTLLSTTFARGDGGFGGPARKPEELPPKPHVIPDRKPDAGVTLKTQPNQALFYRLCGDRNPLHAEPAFADAAGFPRPILHGLCTYGIAVRAVVKAACDHDPSRIADINARFTAPVFPGETIHTEIWRDGNIVSFRARLVERDVVVLDHGRVELRD